MPSFKRDAEGEITVTNPNNRSKNACMCSLALCKSKCSCYKFGSGCNEKCSCKVFGGDCSHLFQNLEYFFGPLHKCAASPCFAKYLVAHGGMGFQSIDRDGLRDQMMSSSKYE